MSNDLISRSAFKELLEICECSDAVALIDDFPTAYNVDKVVERIDNEVAGTTNLQLLKIDEIIKAGGNIDNH